MLTLAACTGTTLAQTAPPTSRFPMMRQMHRQMEQIETQTRTEILGALTPAHRTMLARIAGQLAVTTTPNFRAASQQLETALSPTEKQTILASETSARTQMRAMMEKMRAQMPPPPAGASPMPGRPAFGGPGSEHGREHRHPDAGTVLLRTAMRVAMVR
jgi:hypothetical protein